MIKILWIIDSVHQLFKHLVLHLQTTGWGFFRGAEGGLDLTVGFTVDSSTSCLSLLTSLRRSTDLNGNREKNKSKQQIIHYYCHLVSLRSAQHGHGPGVRCRCPDGCVVFLSRGRCSHRRRRLCFSQTAFKCLLQPAHLGLECMHCITTKTHNKNPINQPIYILWLHLVHVLGFFSTTHKSMV